MAQLDAKINFNAHICPDSFPILPSGNSAVIGNNFFEKHNIAIIPGEHLLKVPDITYQLIKINITKKRRRKFQKSRYPLYLHQKTFINPQKQEIFQTIIAFSSSLEVHTGNSNSLEDYEKSTQLRLSSSVDTARKDKTVSILFLNFNDHSMTFLKNKRVAVFQIFSPQEEEYLTEIGL